MSEPRLTTELRQAVAARAEGCCEYCWSQAQYATQAFSVEHIVPRAKGGTSTLDNLALSCQGCNNHKYNKTEGVDPVNHVVVPLYHPRNQRWHDHFVWSDDYTLILGLTPIGRATIETLRLNRPGVVNLRRILYRLGEHPPKIMQQKPE
jgi:hypothetical protein